jgi:hypothetical protein
LDFQAPRLKRKRGRKIVVCEEIEGENLGSNYDIVVASSLCLQGFLVSLVNQGKTISLKKSVQPMEAWLLHTHHLRCLSRFLCRRHARPNSLSVGAVVPPRYVHCIWRREGVVSARKLPQRRTGQLMEGDLEWRCGHIRTYPRMACRAREDAISGGARAACPPATCRPALIRSTAALADCACAYYARLFVWPGRAKPDPAPPRPC